MSAVKTLLTNTLMVCAALALTSAGYIHGERASLDHITNGAVQDIAAAAAVETDIGEETPHRLLAELDLPRDVSVGLSISPDGAFCVAGYHDKGIRFTADTPAVYDSAAGGTGRLGAACEVSGVKTPTDAEGMDMYEVRPTPTAVFGGTFFMERESSYVYTNPAIIPNKPWTRALYIAEKT